METIKNYRDTKFKLLATFVVLIFIFSELAMIHGRSWSDGASDRAIPGTDPETGRTGSPRPVHFRIRIAH